MPQQGMAYDYLSDPGAGPEVYQNAMHSWGMIGIDFGLTLGHGRIAQAMQWAERSYLVHAQSALSDRTASNMALRQASRKAFKRYGDRIDAVTAPSRRPGPWKKKAPVLGSKYTAASRGMKGIGWFAAIVGIADFGYSLMSDMAAPGVSREARDRDREALSNSEGMLDTRMAYTQRQRAIQAIHDSQLSVGRSMIGQESSYLHR